MFLRVLGVRFYIHTGRSFRHVTRVLGLSLPAAVTDMYLAGEHPDYIAAAILAVNTTGA